MSTSWMASMRAARIIAEAKAWLVLRPNATAEAKRTYRTAVNDVLCLMEMYDVAEIVRAEIGRLFFPEGVGSEERSKE